MQGIEMIGCPPDRATAEARLKQQPYDQRDSLLLRSDEDLYMGDDNWREEQDRRYTAASQQAWKAMTPSDIAREGLMKREARGPGEPVGEDGLVHRLPPTHKKVGRSGQRKAQAEARRKKEGLYPSPTPDDLKALRNK